MKRTLLLNLVVRATAFLGLCFLSATPGMAQGASGVAHYFFVGATAGTQHVYQLYCSSCSGSVYTLQDVTAAASAPVPASLSSALTSYSLSSGAEHIYFIGSNQHVNELVCCWSDNDISAVAGGPDPVSTSPLTSYVDSYGEHVVYLGANQHVYLLFYSYSTSRWSLTDLTAITSGALAATNSRLTSFADQYGEYISYEGTNEHIYWMYLTFGGSPWHNQDITAAAGGALAASGTSLTSLADRIGEHIFYQATNGSIYTLVVTSSWASEDLTLASEPQPALGTALSSFADSNGIHVYFITTNAAKQMYEYFYYYAENSWNGQILDAVPPGSGNALTSLSTSGGYQNVAYISNWVENPPGTVYCSVCLFSSNLFLANPETDYLAGSQVALLPGTVQPENVLSSQMTSFVKQ